MIAGGDNSTFYPCSCCDLSWPISKCVSPILHPYFLTNRHSIINTCPKTDLSIIDFTKYIASVSDTLGSEAKNCTILQNGTDTCIKDYNFPFVGTTAYNPLSLPKGEPGTEPLSNAAGNAFTVFPAGVNTTLSLLPSHITTVTPATFATTAAADSRAISGTSIVGWPVTSKSSSVKSTTTSSGSTATKTGAAVRMGRDEGVVVLAVAVVVVGML